MDGAGASMQLFQAYVSRYDTPTITPRGQEEEGHKFESATGRYLAGRCKRVPGIGYIEMAAVRAVRAGSMCMQSAHALRNMPAAAPALHSNVMAQISGHQA
jgi:hypothetical protein